MEFDGGARGKVSGFTQILHDYILNILLICVICNKSTSNHSHLHQAMSEYICAILFKNVILTDSALD